MRKIHSAHKLSRILMVHCTVGVRTPRTDLNEVFSLTGNPICLRWNIVNFHEWKNEQIARYREKSIYKTLFKENIQVFNIYSWYLTYCVHKKSNTSINIVVIMFYMINVTQNCKRKLKATQRCWQCVMPLFTTMSMGHLDRYNIWFGNRPAG